MLGKVLTFVSWNNPYSRSLTLFCQRRRSFGREKEYNIFPCNYVDPTKEQQRDAAGRWVEDDIELRNMARNFYIFL